MKRYCVSVLLILLLSACGSPEAPAPTATPEAAPTEAGTPTPKPQLPPLPEPSATPTESPPTIVPPPTETPAPSAEYQLTFEATWSASTHPTDFPPNPHFSGLIGASHSPEVHLWEVGGISSPGIENMAETGSKSPLDAEINALIDEGSACGLISGGGVNPSPDTVTVVFEATLDCPLVSVVTMIAPSPDWFVGVSGLSLLQDGRWVDQVAVELYPYDAGTDSGVSYTSPDLATGDPEPIYRIEADPLLVDGQVPPLGTFTFTRLGD